MTVHRHKPFIDGIAFDDTYGMQDSVKSELCYAGMVFLTEFRRNGKEYGGLIIARNVEHAHERASERGFGEKVLARLEAYGNVRDLPNDPPRT